MFKKPKLSLPSSEFKSYCDAHTADESVLPLEWWKVNASLYPNLSRIARAYLGIPGTSAHSELFFPGGRQLITDFRCSLSPTTTRA